MSINLFGTDKSIFHFSIHYQLLQITRKLSLMYTSKASHSPISQLLEVAIIGAPRRQ